MWLDQSSLVSILLRTGVQRQGCTCKGRQLPVQHHRTLLSSAHCMPQSMAACMHGDEPVPHTDNQFMLNSRWSWARGGSACRPGAPLATSLLAQLAQRYNTTAGEKRAHAAQRGALRGACGAQMRGSCMVPSLSASARCAWMSLDRKRTCGCGIGGAREGAHHVRAQRQCQACPTNMACMPGMPTPHAPPPASLPPAATSPTPHQGAVVGLVSQHLIKVVASEVGHRRHSLRQIPPHRHVARLLARLHTGGRAGEDGV